MDGPSRRLLWAVLGLFLDGKWNRKEMMCIHVHPFNVIVRVGAVTSELCIIDLPLWGGGDNASSRCYVHLDDFIETRLCGQLFPAGTCTSSIVM